MWHCILCYFCLTLYSSSDIEIHLFSIPIISALPWCHTPPFFGSCFMDSGTTSLQSLSLWSLCTLNPCFYIIDLTLLMGSYNPYCIHMPMGVSSNPARNLCPLLMGSACWTSTPAPSLYALGAGPIGPCAVLWKHAVLSCLMSSCKWFCLSGIHFSGFSISAFTYLFYNLYQVVSSLWSLLWFLSWKLFSFPLSFC